MGRHCIPDQVERKDQTSLSAEAEESLGSPLLLLVQPLLEGVEGVHPALVLRRRRPADIYNNNKTNPFSEKQNKSKINF